jgi:hypothetical protein
MWRNSYCQSKTYDSYVQTDRDKLIMTDRQSWTKLDFR